MHQGFARTAPLAGRKRHLLRCFALAALLTALFLAASVSSAGAAVTIGSNLGREPNIQSNYSPRPTFSNLSLASDRQAPGGLASPVNGTVVRWRIRVGDVTEVTNFRIIRPLASGLFTGAGTSAPVTPPIGATTPYDAHDTQLPIQIGDHIGLDCCNPAEAEFFVTGGAAIRNEWQPSLADGGPGAAPFSTNPYEVAINAEIDPTSTFTLYAIKRNKKKGTATLTASVPNPGQLTGSSKGVKVAAKTVTAPGRVKLTVRARGKKQRTLNATGKVKVKPKITYIPTGGDPRTQSVKVKLKKT